MRTREARALTLHDYWRIVTHRWWLVAIAMLAAVIPAVALSLSQDPLYVAEARMLLQSAPGESLFGNDFVYTEPERTVANEIEVLEGDIVYQQVIDDLGLTEDPPAVTGTSEVDTDIVSVTVESGDPDTAAALANAYVNAYKEVKRNQAVQGLEEAGQALQEKVTELQDQIDAIDQQILTANEEEQALLDVERRKLVDTQGVFNQRLDQVQVDAALSTGSAQLVQPAYAPDSPVEPTPRRTAALALAVGLLLGLGAVFLLDYLDDSIRTPDDVGHVAPGTSVLAVVPTDPPPDHRPIAISRPDDAAVEAYRTLRTNVQFMGVDQTTQVIEVTSAAPGEGKTTTASNLAVVLAQTGASVVLVDADLRKPRVQQLFTITNSKGLTDNLLGEPLSLTLRTVDHDLGVIIAGSTPPNPSELLSGKRMAALIADLRQRFDHIILDTAPTLPVSDAVALSRHVDAVLVVAQAGRTTAPQLERTLSSLDQVSAPVLGIVLNRAKQRRGGDPYGYGYGGYGGYGDGDRKGRRGANGNGGTGNGAVPAASDAR